MRTNFARHAIVALVPWAALASLAFPAQATVSSASFSPGARAFATFLVNSETRGEHVIIFRPDGLWVSLVDLHDDGLEVPQRVRALADRDGYVLLTSLFPDIVASFDRDGPTVKLDAVSPAFLTRRSRISIVGAPQQQGVARRDRSAVLNYSLRADSSLTLSGAQDVTFSDYSKTIYFSGFEDRRGFHRGVVNVVWEDEYRRKRTVLGDVMGDSGELGSSIHLDGVSIARSFASQPNRVRSSTPTLSGSALSPSTADVYVNGQLIRTIDIAPGAFDLTNISAGSGLTEARVVVRDAFGRTQTIVSKYFTAISLLPKGETDYAYAFGRSGDGFAALGRYDVGMTDGETVGGHAEFGKAFENVGIEMNRSSRIGVSHLGIAESADRSIAGLALDGSFSFSSGPVTFNASLDVRSPGYTAFAERQIADRTVLREQVGIGVRPSRDYSVNLDYLAFRSRIGVFTKQWSLQQSLYISRGLMLSVAAGVASSSSGTHPAVSVFLSRAGGRSSPDTLSLSARNDGGALHETIELQHPAPPYGGAGYDISVDPNGTTPAKGRYDVRSSIGNLDIDYDVSRNRHVGVDADVTGAVAFAGGYAHLSQPIADGFALVRVDGGERANVLVDNQVVGATDKRGLLVVPNMQSYFTKKIAIERDDGPVNLNVSSGDQKVTVAAHHGAIASFTATSVRAIMGTVSVAENKTQLATPSFGLLTLHNGPVTYRSDLDATGRFYFENAPAGSYEATITYSGGICSFALELPHSESLEANIGSFTCER